MKGKLNRFVGFNQVWLNCPQPLCMDPSTDAIMPIHESLLIFRGRFVWTVNETVLPLIKHAKPIKELFPDIPDHIDDAFKDNYKKYYFIKVCLINDIFN